MVLSVVLEELVTNVCEDLCALHRMKIIVRKVSENPRCVCVVGGWGWGGRWKGGG